MPSDNRDQQFERALAQHLRNASPYSDCPDAETLAAYHERTLSLEELARWKEHIARCTRCQESLALVERSEDLPAEEWEHQNVPVPLDGIVLPQHMRAAGANIQQKEVVLNAAPASTPTPIRKAAERPRWRWIVPAGALAASVIVWIGVKEIRTQRGHPVESVQVAQNRPVGAETPAPSIETRDQLKQEEPAQRPLPEENRLQSKVATPAPRSMPSPKIAAPGVAGAPLSTTGDASTAVQKDKEFSSGERVAPPQPVPPVSSYNAKSEAKEMLAPPAANAPFQAGAGGGATAKSPTRAQKKAETSAMAESVEVQGAAPSAATLSAISGKILDPSGAAIRGAVVTVISASSGNSTSAIADDEGKFQVAGLHGDEYRVVVSHAGFTSSEQTLTLQPLQPAQLVVRLGVASVTETVEVTGAAPALDTTSSTLAPAPPVNVKSLNANARNYTALQTLISDPRYIAAPDAKFLWRAGDAGKIEHSTDRGQTWKLQKSGVTVDLTAGSATSEKVCWIVGKAGALLLTTDGGKHWKTISSPITEDLGGVLATGAMRATIWDVPHLRTFETTDCGTTWNQVSNK